MKVCKSCRALTALIVLLFCTCWLTNQMVKQSTIIGMLQWTGFLAAFSAVVSSVALYVAIKNKRP